MEQKKLGKNYVFLIINEIKNKIRYI